jgi:hypothetical protein
MADRARKHFIGRDISENAKITLKAGIFKICQN